LTVKVIAGALILSMILVPTILQAADYEWRIGTEFTYVRRVGDQTSEYTMRVVKSEHVDDNLCWKVEVRAQDEVAYYWYDKDSMGVWKSSQELFGTETVSTWSPSPANMILPIGDRRYETKMEIKMGKRSIGETTVSYEIRDKGEETVTVPAGTFSAHHLVIVATTYLNGAPMDSSTRDVWFCPEIGNLVRERQDFMGELITAELKSYKI
jgi:hypothetical protein